MMLLSVAAVVLLSGAASASGARARRPDPEGETKTEKPGRNLRYYYSSDKGGYGSSKVYGGNSYGGNGYGGYSYGGGQKKASYERSSNRACRNHYYGKGSRYYDYNLHRHVSRGYCEGVCNGLGDDCHGYEYAWWGRCEIWKVPVPHTQYKLGLDCYVKSRDVRTPVAHVGQVHISDDAVVEVKTPLEAEPPASVGPCFTVADYDSIDDDVAALADAAADGRARSHFLGGVLRLTAHDFMDYDPHRSRSMGPDGCFDEKHPVNFGLLDIWCPSCPLKLLRDRKYSHVSRADFWVAAANAVIRRASAGNVLDLKANFVWGRKDTDSCRGSGRRQPTAAGCSETEDVFLRRMGLDWKDAVALMGGHTLGRGSVSHQGTWSASDDEAQVFDKKYYEELVGTVWWPRDPADVAGPDRNWVTEREDSLMLHTDICLVYDIDRDIGNGVPCCTETDDRCTEPVARERKCPVYTGEHGRFEALEAVREMLGGGTNPDPNAPFYHAFAEAWGKATTVGQKGLVPLAERCS